MRFLRKSRTAFLLSGLLAASCGSVHAQKAYGPGVTDTEIKIGNVVPQSGRSAASSQFSKTIAAYFGMINAQGGVTGRKINFISYDDEFNEAKSIEQTRKLVESDEVLLMLGTPGYYRLQEYLNARQVPQLFVNSPGTRFGRATEFPWTMGWAPPFQAEGRVFAKYILQARPDARIAVLYQNNDLGKELLQGLKDGLGARAASMIALEQPHEWSKDAIDDPLVKLKQTGADVLASFTTGYFAMVVIDKMADTGWKPLHLQTGAFGGFVGQRYHKLEGMVSTEIFKRSWDPAWKSDPGMRQYFSFIEDYFPGQANCGPMCLQGYAIAQATVQVLKQAGDDLSRTNVMRQAASLKACCDNVLLPGITVNTSATDYYPIEQLQLVQYRGERWETIGEVIGGELDGRGKPAVAVEAKLPTQATQPPAAAQQQALAAVARPQPPPSAPSVSPAVNTPGRKVALVIGNSAYKFMPSLQNPRNDAADVENALKGLGFETVLATDLDRLGMNGAIDRYSRLVKGANVAMVYYSGHGMQFMGKNYLLPTDANLESSEDVNRYRLLPVDDLVELLGQSNGLQLIVLDACRNNPIERDFKNKVASVAGGNRDVASTRGFARLDTRSGLVVTYATAPNDVAADGTGRNSPFTAAFLKNVAMPDVGVIQMLFHVQREVFASSGSKQLPEISSLYVGPEIRLKSSR